MYTNNNKRSVLPSNPGGEADEPSWLYRHGVTNELQMFSRRSFSVFGTYLGAAIWREVV